MVKKEFVLAIIALIIGIVGEVRAQLDYKAMYTLTAPDVNGIGDESCWNTVEWAPINVEWFTNAPDCPPDDFSGRFKVVWTEERLYILVEIVDDILNEDIIDPLYKYWEDDCLEVFIDENRSGGDHKYNYNAFAYHIGAVTKDIVDIGIDKKPHLFNDHAQVAITNVGTTYTWEIGFLIYGDNFVYGGNNVPEILFEGKKMGLSLAYCDDDGNGRENFIGTEPGGLDSWINASLFGKLELVKDSTITSIGISQPSRNEEIGQFIIYPNPARDVVFVSPAPGWVPGPYEVELHDLKGSLLGKFASGEGKDQTRIDLPVSGSRMVIVTVKQGITAFRSKVFLK
jgi:hypothetical protein